MCEIDHRPSTLAWPPIIVVVDSDFLVAFRGAARGAVVEQVYVADVVRKEMKIDVSWPRLRRRVRVCKPRERAVLTKLGLQGQRRQPGLRQALSGPDWTVLLATACLINIPPTSLAASDPTPPIVLLTGEGRIAEVAGLDFHLVNLPVASPVVQGRRWFFVSNVGGIGAVQNLIANSRLPFPLP